MRAVISYATAFRMKYSPVPVQDTAQVLLSAYVPAPMMGESPTRPRIFIIMPPVEVPAARFPYPSSATQPTVPFLFCDSSCFFRSAFR